MTTLAVALVLTSAFLHATWNLYAKRVGGGAAFTWLISIVPAVLYAPFGLGVLLIERPALGPEALLFIAGSSLLHVAYFLALSRGYRTGDLSLVYPLARGTGPLLSTAAAVLLLAERPTPLALFGATLIGVSALALTGDPRKIAVASRGAVGYALLTGGLIAIYTLWDRHAVAALHIPPLLYDWSNNIGRMVLLMPLALRYRADVQVTWRDYRREVIGVSILSPLAYILVLTALAFSPVSYVAPMRESSILIGAILGARLLAEEDARRRLSAAGMMVGGVLALAFG